MIELVYIVYSLFAQLLYYQEERGWLSNNLLLFIIFTARHLMALIFRKKLGKIPFQTILKLFGLGILQWMEYHLFLDAFSLGNVSEIQAFLVLRVLFEIMVNASKISLKSLVFAIGILMTTLVSPLLTGNSWGIYFHVANMALNITVSKAYFQMANLDSEVGVWQKQVYMSLIAMLISLGKGFKGIDFSLKPSVNSYLAGSGFVVLALMITTRKSSLEGSKFFSWASSLLLSCFGSSVFGKYPLVIFILSTLASHLMWIFYIYDSQRLGYDLLPVSLNRDSVKPANRTSTPKNTWKRRLLLLFLTILVFANDMGGFLNSKENMDNLTDNVSAELEKPFLLIHGDQNSSQNVDSESQSFVEYSDWKKILPPLDQPKSIICDELYGSGLIKKFQESKTNVCSSKTKHGTNIDCFYYKGRKGVSEVNFESLCEITHFGLDLEKISKFNFTQKSKLEFWAMNSILKSTLGTCRLDKALIKEKIHTEEPSAYLLNSYWNDDTLQCKEYYNKTILFISRWDTTNQYHATEDFLQAWVTLLVSGIDPRNTIVVRLDTKTMGPFTSFFTYALSGKTVPIDEKKDTNLTSDIINIVDWAKQSKISCFSRAVFGIFAVPSPVSFEMYQNHPNPTSCGPPDTSLFTSFKDFVIKSFDFIPDSKLEPQTEVHLTYITRKGFLRHIINEEYMLKKISEAVCSSSKDCRLKIQVYDFQKITFYQQISIVRNTDILLGMHGAALTSSIYLPNSSTLIEIGHPSRFKNQHFQNIARFMGLKYEVFDGDDLLSDVTIGDISNSIKKEVSQRMQL